MLTAQGFKSLLSSIMFRVGLEFRAQRFNCYVPRLGLLCIAFGMEFAGEVHERAGWHRLSTWLAAGAFANVVRDAAMRVL